ncbi:MAG TPA: protein kinase [Kofleriaceae bacterium]|nr:protein kinase [Kofleriaceae bacterium]
MSEGPPTEHFGPYVVYEQLGVGGMAQVHRAVAMDSAVQRPVALKRMLSHIASSEDMVKSFVREARLASYLRHPNVPQTYDLGRVGEIYFIVMELITGRNLREVLKHCGRTTGPMPVRIALNILNQICDALDYAHNLCDESGEPLGIIHRDVSPSNVIVSETGVVKLIDFGIAKASAAGMQTMSGTLKGKFAYMAPEYIQGHIDARADLFAVGVIAHELLTNRPLFAGRDDIDTLTRVRDMHIDPPSRKNPLVPPEIDDIVMTALARDPDRRWQHATALRSALTTLTQRLDLVASNAQVVEWLDWAFTQRPARSSDRADQDTQAEIARDDDEPSLSLEQQTARILAMSKKRWRAAADPAPPTSAPTGTPAFLPAQRAGPGPITDLGARAGDVRFGPEAAPQRAPTSPPSGARTSSMIPMDMAPSADGSPDGPTIPMQSSLLPPGRPGSTVLGTDAPAPPPARAVRASSAPVVLHPDGTPISAALAAHLQAAQSLGSPGGGVLALQPGAPAEVSPGRPAPVSDSGPVSGPGMVAAPTAPLPAASPLRTMQPPLSHEPSRASSMQPEPARPRSVRMPVAPRAESSRWLAVVLVVLAAAIAAITVYFVLPLLT